MTEKEVERSERWLAPECDIWEDQDAYVVVLDMPGVAQENLALTYEAGSLRIEGRVSSAKVEGYRCGRQEYAVDGYRRQFSVSENIDPDGIQARLRNGELQVRLPKSERIKPRRIPIA